MPIDGSTPVLSHPSFDHRSDGGLTNSIGEYFDGGIKKSTRARYFSACMAFVAWMVAARRTWRGLCPAPTEVDLCFFAGHRARQGILPGGVRKELTAVGQWFRAHGFPHPLIDPITGKGLFRLYRVMRGITLAHSTATRTRLPLTTGLLRRLRTVLRLACPWLCDADVELYWCALTLGVYGMLRVGEFVAPAVSSSTEFTTRRSDLQLVEEDNGGVLILHLRDSKTDYARQGVTIRIHENRSETCPVAAYRRVATARPTRATDSVLFTQTDGTYMTRDRITRVLRASLAHLGFDPVLYASHSLRIGGVVSASAAGFGIETLKKLGRWASDAVLVYLQLPESVLRSAHRGMGSVSDDALENDDLRQRAFAARRGDC